MLPKFCYTSITDNILLHKWKTNSLYNVTACPFYCLLNSVRYDIPVCKIYTYVVTCISMVITSQTLEFGWANTVLGETLLYNFLQEKQDVDNASSNKNTHYYAIIKNERLGLITLCCMLQ
jgi:hypothetical protein